MTVFCPVGAIAGLLLGVKLAMRGQDPSQFLRNALVAGGVTLAAVAVIGGGVDRVHGRDRNAVAEAVDDT